MRTGSGSLPRGVSADIFGERARYPAAPARDDRPSSLPPPAPPVEPWPVVDPPVRQERAPVPASAETRPKGHLLRYALIGLFALLALGYLVPAFLMSGRIPTGTTVLGVDIGGLSRAEAAVVLRDRLYAQTHAPIIVRQGMRRLIVDPAEAGLGLDVTGTLDRARAGFPSPARVWDALTGGREIKPVISVDRNRLAATVSREVAAALDTPSREGGVAFQGRTPVPTYPRRGRAVDQAAVARAIERAYLTPDGTVVVVTRPQYPQVGRAEVRRAVDWARRAVAAPVTVTNGRTSVTLSPGALAKSLTFVPDRHVLRPMFDPMRLVGMVQRGLVAPAEAARDAAVVIVHGRPVLIHGRAGNRLDADRLAADLVDAIDGGSRTVTVTVTSGPPRVTDEELLRLGIKEEIGSFSASACCPPPAAAIRAAARLVNNRLVKPGETVSLNDVIAAGDPGAGTGGPATPGDPGLSWFATAMLNAVMRGGLEVVGYLPPPVHLPGAQPGLEAAVSRPQPDLRWRNDSPYGVLIQASVTRDSLRIALWSTRRFDVEIQGPVMSRHTHLPLVRRGDAGCVPVPGQDGFTAEVTRILRQHGTVVRRQSFQSVYQPRAGVVCRSAR